MVKLQEHHRLGRHLPLLPLNLPFLLRSFALKIYPGGFPFRCTHHLPLTKPPPRQQWALDIPLQGAKAWHLILSKYTRVSTGKIDLLTVSLDVFCDGACLALCMAKERENHINELQPTSWFKRSLLR